MLNIIYSGKFKKDYKLIKKRSYDHSKLNEVLKLVVNNELLPVKYRDHKLMGNYNNCNECHIEPDWLLIYQADSENLILLRTGTHSDLFKK